MSKTFTSQLLKDLDYLYNSKDNYDTIITVDTEEQIYAHYLILCTRSLFFQRALSESWIKKENRYFVLTKPNVNALIFKIILKYLYCAEIDFKSLDIDMLLKLLIAADEFLIQELIDFIQDYLISSNLSQTHSCKILDFVNTSLFTKLKDDFLNIICENPKILFDHEEFLLLDKDALRLVIEHDNLDMKENDIWNYLIKWSNDRCDNIDELKEILCDLIIHVRFYQFGHKEFINHVWNYKNLLQDSLVRDVLLCYSDSNLKPMWDICVDGWSPQSFHSKCDNREATIVVTKIKNTTLLIGGYNPLDWNGIATYKHTTNSFLFLIDYMDMSIREVKYVKQNESAIYCDSNCNPMFGEGDFYIRDGYCLKCKNKSYDKLVNNYNLAIESYEVFQIENITKNNYILV
ncbi:1062_t:CDS:2 [Cetraspora pellucida]|uniref:1062_t:CDS:1 n=1 Tax=Cetraspora pellucida TaxID=1433469 RepID=A0A9N9HUV7_9GLOM|nr:1062_t:CDS:2 [Cetraspora pellucida]